MELRALSLNCQQGYQPGLKRYLDRTLAGGRYDFLLLQEYAEEVARALAPHAYRVEECFNEEMGKRSPMAIFYRSAFSLLSSHFTSFALMHPAEHLQYPGFGFLFGTFDVGGAYVRVGSAHLHAGFGWRLRAAETNRIKQALMEPRATLPVIVGGDFNVALPGERRRAIRLFAPEFVCASAACGPTLDSRLSEYHPTSLANRAAVALTTMGLGLQFRVDHMFVDRATAAGGMECRVLPEHVSDHRPVELVLKQFIPEAALTVDRRTIAKISTIY